jgi:hypothetical protein
VAFAGRVREDYIPFPGAQLYFREIGSASRGVEPSLSRREQASSGRSERAYMNDQATLIGFAGVALLLAAFLLNLFKLLRADGYLYMTLNFVGAGLACYSSYLINFMPFVVLEGVWALVALVAIAKALLFAANISAP